MVAGHSRRRGWMLLTQLLLLASIPLFGALRPQLDLWTIAYLALALAFFAATQEFGRWHIGCTRCRASKRSRIMPQRQRKSGKKSLHHPGADAEGPPQMQTEPKPPMPRQHQKKPGFETDLKPRPRYQAPKYKAAGKLEGKPCWN